MALDEAAAQLPGLHSALTLPPSKPSVHVLTIASSVVELLLDCDVVCIEDLEDL